MWDGFRIQNVSVSGDLLLTNNRLTFGTLFDEQTGAVLDLTRRAKDRGLTFTLKPRPSGEGYWVELKGSIHKFYNNGCHRAAFGNSDDFTVANLLTAIDQLITTYDINPILSRLNNIEFGVNVRLPFPVANALNNLVSYKGRSFSFDTDSKTKTPYHQCQTQRYIVKLYDKGTEYRLDTHLLRVEVKVMRIEYLTRQGIHLNNLSDLLTVANYRRLGALLIKTFRAIVFDDPTVAKVNLTAKERSLYQNGRNPKFWQIPKEMTDKQADAYRQRLRRTEGKYRALLNRYGSGNWQEQTAMLIAQTWERLTTTDDLLLTQINERRAAWANMEKGNFATITPLPDNREGTERNPQKCHILTDPRKPEMSHINTLYSVLKHDITDTITDTEPGAVFCPVTGVKLHHPKPGQRFVSASMLRNDEDLLQRLSERFRQYGKGSKEEQSVRTAHNARNRFTNEYHNLERRVKRIEKYPTLFDVSDTLRLTPDQQKVLGRS